MNKLEELEIEEVSLVDAGANPEADVVLFKREAAEDEASLLVKRLMKRLADMEARTEEQELLKTAQKYELLGERAEDLAKILKAAKAGGTYEKILNLLDKTLAALEKAGTFEEVGSNRQSPVNVEEVAKRLQQNDPKLTWREALDKAYLSNPEWRFGGGI